VAEVGLLIEVDFEPPVVVHGEEATGRLWETSGPLQGSPLPVGLTQPCKRSQTISIRIPSGSKAKNA
jgi:hypothetical protein